MPGILLTGVHSRIIQELKPLLPADCEPVELTRRQCDMASVSAVYSNRDHFESIDRLVIAHGSLGRSFDESLAVNLSSVVQICNFALCYNPCARIVVIGSESVRKGSYDHPYWLAKAALHNYVQHRRLEHPGQQLVCVAPAMIADTGMTACKTSREIDRAIDSTPKKRALTALEVARLIHFLLFVDQGYITNTVIEMDGGKFA